MMDFDFTQDLQDAIHFVMWLREKAPDSQPRMAVVLYSKHGEVDWDNARHFNLESLEFELHHALEIALKTKAAHRLTQGL